MQRNVSQRGGGFPRLRGGDLRSASIYLRREWGFNSDNCTEFLKESLPMKSWQLILFNSTRSQFHLAENVSPRNSPEVAAVQAVPAIVTHHKILIFAQDDQLVAAVVFGIGRSLGH